MWRQAAGILLALWAAHPAAANEPCSPESVLAALQAGGLARIDRMSGFPNDFLTEFWRVIPPYDEPKSFADPGSNFQATDFISEPRLPWRRLIFGGRSPHVTFIYYEKGGRGLSRQLFVTCSQDATVRSFSYLSPREAGETQGLLEELAIACLVTPAREYFEQSELARCR